MTDAISGLGVTISRMSRASGACLSRALRGLGYDAKLMFWRPRYVLTFVRSRRFITDRAV